MVNSTECNGGITVFYSWVVILMGDHRIGVRVIEEDEREEPKLETGVVEEEVVLEMEQVEVVRVGLR